MEILRPRLSFNAPLNSEADLRGPASEHFGL